MRRRALLGQAALSVLAAHTAWTAVPPGTASLAPLLLPLLAEHGLPALAAAAVQDGRIVAAGAVGTRRWGTEAPVTIDDAFHIGSDTKAMTSLLVAMLVEQGTLRWDTTVAEAFPDLVAGMDAGLRGVTLTQLLSHTGGLPTRTTRSSTACSANPTCSPATSTRCGTGWCGSGARSRWPRRPAAASPIPTWATPWWAPRPSAPRAAPGKN